MAQSWPCAAKKDMNVKPECAYVVQQQKQKTNTMKFLVMLNDVCKDWNPKIQIYAIIERW